MGRISFMAKIQTEAEPNYWESHYDNSDFDSYYGTWNVDKWDSESATYYEPDDTQSVSIDVAGTWHEDYRPTKVRVTYTGSDTLDIFVGDADRTSNALVGPGSYTSGEEINITWADYDIAFLSVMNFLDNPFSITNIEWYTVFERSGTPSTWNVDHDEHHSSALLDSTHVVVSYRDWDDDDAGKSVVATIDGTSITWGSTYEFIGGMSSETSSVAIDSTHVLVTYSDPANSWYGTAKIGTISNGDEISWGSAQVFNSGSIGDTYCAMLDSTHVLITYRDGGNLNYGTAIIGTISGATITWGSKYVFNTTGSTYNISCAMLDSTHFVTVYRESGPLYGNAIIGVVSNDDEIAFGSESTFNSATTYPGNVISIDSTHFYVAWDDSNNSGQSIIGTISSGDQISYGSEYEYNAGDSAGGGHPYLIDSTHILLVYQDWGNGQKGVCRVATIANDDEISYGGKFTWNDNNTFYITAQGLDSEHVIAIYNDSGAPDDGEAIIIY